MANNTSVQDIVNLIKRTQEQLHERRQDLRTITDTEIYLSQLQKTVRVWRTAINKVTPRNHPGLINLIQLCDSYDEYFSKITAYQQKFLQERAPHIAESEEIEKDFPRRPDFHFKNTAFYADDIYYEISEKLPGFHYRMRQGIASFYQQLQTHCCLSAPSDRHSLYPRETEYGIRCVSRCQNSNFPFNDEHTVAEAAFHYAVAFVEEFNALGPELFIPYRYLPRIDPSDREIAASLVASAPVVDGVD